MIRKWIVEKFKSPGFHDRISLSSWDAREDILWQIKLNV